MNGTARLPFEDVLRGCGDGPVELLSQICGGPLLAAFAIFRGGDARRFRAPGDEIYRDFCALLRRDALAGFFLEFPELARLVHLCNGHWRDAHREFLVHVAADFGEETI